ncbi:ribosome maturation factor RimP [Vallitalea guaymasensis]|uniref:Ribosome maturation factor RimP n=1 Tax=Vallitalea guaymasensis TaxID=1185412 RepID=A0A8J8MFA6_9FIRM|nr:ribosome maturation factor RimP [Vallitalea guaymasensis]QUH31866.1 ribosome maturation factor RimP [Vallitalea guaymasensis]
MSFREHVETLAEEILIPILEENKFELVDVEYVKEASNWYLRIFIDKDGGVTIDDCELVSRAFDSEFEDKDPIKEPYILEVSSPGLDRPLKKDKDFARSLGEKVEVKLYKSINKKKEFVGLLKSYDDDSITLELEDGEDWSIARTDIAIIRLAILF